MRFSLPRRQILSLLFAVLILLTASLSAAAEGLALSRLPSLLSETAVVIDAENAQVLADKKMHTRMYPASITKVLTAALALEYARLDEEVIITAPMLEDITGDVTHIALSVGEVLTVEQLLYTMMVESANDSAQALAVHVSGSIKGFAALMNAKLAEIGAVNSHFTNPSGLPDTAHYSTAYDMALVTRYAMSVPGFNEVFGAPDYSIPPTNIQPETRYVGTHHCMFVQSAYTYEGTIGGKLGWTSDAKHTCITAAERNGMTLICVTMMSYGKYDKFKDAIALFDACFENYTRLSIPGSSLQAQSYPVYKDGQLVSTAVFSPAESYSVLAPAGTPLAQVSLRYTAPGQGEDTARVAALVGEITAWEQEVPLTVAEAPAQDAPAMSPQKPQQNAAGEKEGKKGPGVLLTVLIIAAVLGVALFLLAAYRPLIRRKLRQRQMAQKIHRRSKNIWH